MADTDRELLELAAKAAGYLETAVIQDGFGFIGLAVMDSDGDWTGKVWNPLTDDGDALRLAVKIPVCIVVDNEMKWCGVHLHGERGKYEFVEHFGDDPCAATRRAIVRAAAAIGATHE